jgi:hypothetical protein
LAPEQGRKPSRNFTSTKLSSTLSARSSGSAACRSTGSWLMLISVRIVLRLVRASTWRSRKRCFDSSTGRRRVSRADSNPRSFHPRSISSAHCEPCKQRPRENPPFPAGLPSGRRDSNSGPLVPQASQRPGGRSGEVAGSGLATSFPDSTNRLESLRSERAFPDVWARTGPQNWPKRPLASEPPA